MSTLSNLFAPEGATRAPDADAQQTTGMDQADDAGPTGDGSADGGNNDMLAPPPPPDLTGDELAM